ncbi:hypothetical protein [Haloparvum sedimenti]|uniref:hypothetical protein n=1 Tax=Haloparvum sedimenti TaxID=1678448 RepID=UPI00071E8E0A|nr:hypothetical protein [Haloparvum sedimenti]
MSDTLTDRGGTALRVAVVFFAALSVAAAYVRVSEFGLEALPDALVSVYIAALIVWGVFREGLRTTRFRILLYVGVIAWGATGLIGDPSDAVSLILLGGGLLLLGRTLYQEYRRRNSPVYDR